MQTDIQSGAISVIPTDDAVRSAYFAIVEQCLARLPPLFIRTNDALRLAAARCAAETEVVATDKRLRDAALLLDFNVFPQP